MLQKTSFALACLLILTSHAHSDDAEPQAVARLRKKVEAAAKVGQGDYYVVLLLKSTFHERRIQHQYSKAFEKNGELFREKGHWVIESGRGYCPQVEFAVIEGTDAAVGAIVDHMTPLLAAPPKKKEREFGAGGPPAKGDWKLIGRFADPDKAAERLSKAKAAYDAEPHWEPAEKE